MKSVVCFAMLVALAGTLWASPAQLITRPPVAGPSAGPTGTDPGAVNGMWFTNLLTGDLESRPYEFYDNAYQYGGSMTHGTSAIYGRAMNVQYVGSNIVSFDIQATITNDTTDPVYPLIEPPQTGTNTHGEIVSRQLYQGDMIRPKLTCEFAVDPRSFNPLYWAANPRFVDTTPYIMAQNVDELGWYSYPGIGGYVIPTYDFYAAGADTIAPGGSYTKLLSFSVSGTGLPPTDPRNAAIAGSYVNGSDLLSNRSTSLKVGEWISTLAVDDGSPYPDPPGFSGDSSVFFLPEPAAAALLGLAGLALWRRR
jgi:MYXO-CTERM domain-containing protein